MSDPISFDSTTPRLGLPYLFAGQAQKEAFVNEAHSLIDALLHCAVESETATPPAAPLDGQSWLVGAAPTGVWSGQGGKIACRQGGNWLFVAPRAGMRLFNRASGQDVRYSGSAWLSPVTPALPTGGTVIDTQARAAIAAIVDALVIAEILP